MKFIILVCAIAALLALFADEFPIWIDASLTAQNPCPASWEKDYGANASFDGIHISGSPRFVSRTIVALQILWGKPSYRYAQNLRLIRESSRPPSFRALAWYNWRGVMEALPKTAELGCAIYASIIVHEGAHAVYGAGHGPVYAAESQALRELNEPAAAAVAYARIAER